MAGSLIDLFPPEAQTLLGIVSALSAVAGLFIWGAGIKIARVAVAILLGVSVSGLAAWMLPGATGIAPLTAALIGFVVGVLAGAVTFRLVQGGLLALCLTAAVMGSYYHWEVGKVAGTPRPGGTTMAASEMLISVPRLPESPETSAGVAPHSWDAAGLASSGHAWAHAAQNWVLTRWEGMPAVHRQRMAALAILTALVGLLLAIWFPRHTTWILTAAIGTIMLVSAAMMLLQVFAPQYGTMIPTRPAVVYGTLGGIMLVGMLMQWLVFWPRKKGKPKAVAAIPVV